MPKAIVPITLHIPESIFANVLKMKPEGETRTHFMIALLLRGMIYTQDQEKIRGDTHDDSSQSA